MKRDDRRAGRRRKVQQTELRPDKGKSSEIISADIAPPPSDMMVKGGGSLSLSDGLLSPLIKNDKEYRIFLMV